MTNPEIDRSMLSDLQDELLCLLNRCDPICLYNESLDFPPDGYDCLIGVDSDQARTPASPAVSAGGSSVAGTARWRNGWQLARDSLVRAGCRAAARWLELAARRLPYENPHLEQGVVGVRPQPTRRTVAGTS
jgi:hypothetical protein